ncbi:MAG: xanthine dehydrogenase accessory factor [Verrucomicrobiota bacterium]|jgi:xanthine dehydrogenase accessory factor
MPQFYEQLLDALAGSEPFALGLIAGIKGSSPQKQGAKALFFADGRIVGTLGGGCLEAEIQDRARRALLTGQPATFDLVLDHDFGWDDGLICGGRVSGLILPRAADADPLWRELLRRDRARTWGVSRDFSINWAEEGADEDYLYRETVFPPCTLWIGGSGHVAQAVAPLAVQLDFEVTVFDDRPTFASAKYFPEKVKCLVGSWEEIFRQHLPNRPAFGLVVTRGHQRDALVLANWIHRRFAFLGMIGSRRKARLIFDQFLDEHLATPDEIARVACPVGIDIGSQTVPEIAVSILAQLIQKRAEVLRAPVTESTAAK